MRSDFAQSRVAYIDRAYPNGVIPQPEGALEELMTGMGFILISPSGSTMTFAYTAGRRVPMVGS